MRASSINRALQVHHIWGRGRAPELNFHCSLALVSKACHDCGHDFSPLALEVCSIASRWNRHVTYRDLLETGIQEELPPHRLYWNVEAMNKAAGGAGLAGRLEGIVMPELKSGVFYEMAGRLVRLLEKKADAL